jgi:predicted RNA polymerase sigma factor
VSPQDRLAETLRVEGRRVLATLVRTRTHLWHAARADVLTRLGRIPEARTELVTALAGAPTTPDQRLLTRRLAAL